MRVRKEFECDTVEFAQGCSKGGKLEIGGLIFDCGINVFLNIIT